MNKSFKVASVILLLAIAVGSIVAYTMWNKPQRKVENEKGIEVTSAQLVKEYQANEAEANKKYLDKAIQVTGTVSELNTNQEGFSTISLASGDALTSVFCTLKEKGGKIANGNIVTIKGICSGMLSDVRLRDAVIVK